MEPKGVNGDIQSWMRTEDSRKSSQPPFILDRVLFTMFAVIKIWFSLIEKNQDKIRIATSIRPTEATHIGTIQL